MKNKIIDLFCGCGGLSKGFEMAGFSTILAIDFWADAIKTFNYNRCDKVGICDDIHNITKEYLSRIKNEVVGVIGGPPCQGFSTVGKREVNDPRNSLYLEYCRIVEELKPRFFVLENVKGLLTLAGGAFKNDIINRFSKLGYKVTFKVVNSADYGVPQNRYRVFFVGVLGDKEFLFPEPLDNVLSSSEAISDLDFINEANGDKDFYEYPCESHNFYQQKMRKNSKGIFNHQITKHSEQTKEIISLIPDGGRIKDLPKEYWEIRKYNKAFERMNSKKPSNTVDTGHRNYFHFSENRIPTVRENCRLQSFDDSFIVLGSRTSQYKQIGNAVPPLLAEAIAKEIMKQIGGLK